MDVELQPKPEALDEGDGTSCWTLSPCLGTALAQDNCCVLRGLRRIASARHSRNSVIAQAPRFVGVTKTVTVWPAARPFATALPRLQLLTGA